MQLVCFVNACLNCDCLELLGVKPGHIEKHAWIVSILEIKMYCSYHYFQLSQAYLACASSFSMAGLFHECDGRRLMNNESEFDTKRRCFCNFFGFRVQRPQHGL